MESEYVALFLIWVGVVLRTVVPALRKYRDAMKDDEKEFEWSLRYTVSAALSLLVASVTSLIGFTMFTLPDPFVGLPVYIGAVVYGMGLNELITEVGAWAFDKET